MTALGDAIAFVCLALTLQVLKVGIADALWSGIGMVLILAGVVVINLSSRVTVR